MTDYPKIFLHTQLTLTSHQTDQLLQVDESRRSRKSNLHGIDNADIYNYYYGGISDSDSDEAVNTDSDELSEKDGSPTVTNNPDSVGKGVAKPSELLKTNESISKSSEASELGETKLKESVHVDVLAAKMPVNCK